MHPVAVGLDQQLTFAFGQVDEREQRRRRVVLADGQAILERPVIQKILEREILRGAALPLVDE